MNSYVGAVVCILRARRSAILFRVEFFFKPRFYEILTWRWIVKIWTRVVWSSTKPVTAKAMRGCWDLCAQCESHVVCGIGEILFALQGLPLFLSSRQRSKLCRGMGSTYKVTMFMLATEAQIIFPGLNKYIYTAAFHESAVMRRHAAQCM